MKANHRSINTGENYKDIHNGHYSSETLPERVSEKANEAYEDRLHELRRKAEFALNRIGFEARGADITQIGKNGFYYKRFKQTIPDFEPWCPATVTENERIFNGRT